MRNNTKQHYVEPQFEGHRVVLEASICTAASVGSDVVTDKKADADILQQPGWEGTEEKSTITINEWDN